MKSFARIGLLGSGIGLMLLTAAPSFATVVGELFTGGTGTVTVTATGITFSMNDSAGGSTEVGTGTTLTSSDGALAVTNPVQINMGAPITALTPLPLSGFMTFPTSPTLNVSLDNFQSGSLNHNCSGLSTGESCSPLIGGFASPIILTYTGPGVEGALGSPNVGTSALLGIVGTATDSSGVISTFTGHFSASLATETPADLAATFSTPGSSFTTTYAGDFVATSPVPEPRTVSVIAIAGLLMGLVLAKRKNSVA